MQLLVGGRQQFGRGRIHVGGCLRHPCGRILNVGHQRAQLFHGVIDRVGNGTGDVFSHRCFLRQIALSYRLQLIHQTQDGRLVAIVHALGLQLLTLGIDSLALGNRLAGPAVLQLQE